MEDIFTILCVEEHEKAYADKMTHADTMLNKNRDLKTLSEALGYKRILVFLDSETAREDILDGETEKIGNVGIIYLKENLDSFSIVTSVYTCVYKALIKDGYRLPSTPDEFKKELFESEATTQDKFKEAGFITSKKLKDCEMKVTQTHSGFEMDIMVPIYIGPN